MKNPLEQFFPVEERPDGVYVKIGRTERESLRVDAVFRQIAEAKVMNFDGEKFKDILSRARGAFEKVGPPFEYYDEELETFLYCSITPIKASLKISEKVMLKGKKPSAQHLAFYLKRKGIVHGVDSALLDRMRVESIFDRFIDVAAATPPEKGADARIEIKAAISHEAKPQLRSDGSVDYRSIQTFTSVAKGDTIAVKYPPSPGKPGTTVTGEPIPAEPGRDIQLPNGRNTELSSDGLELHASTTGILFYDNSLLAVAELLHVGTDVDYSVGNIKYTGDVLIDGMVKPGFSVEAEGSIHIKGDVESATITSRAGEVIIDKGIVGKGETIITAKKGIRLSFAQDTQFQTEGIVTFDKYLLHCKVVCASMEGSGHQCSIIGGDIKAEKSVVIKMCGSDKGIATKISIYDKNKTLIGAKIKELSELQVKLTAELEPIERQLKTKAALMKRAGEEISDRHREEVKKWVDAYNGMKKKIDYVIAKIKELNTAFNNPGDRGGYIQVLDRCFPGTTISLYDIVLPINVVYSSKRFRLKDQSITIEGQVSHEQSK